MIRDEHRHMISAPEQGIILHYGCTHCHWMYRPELTEVSYISWMAQFLFEKHNCYKHGSPVTNLELQSFIQQQQRHFKHKQSVKERCNKAWVESVSYYN